MRTWFIWAPLASSLIGCGQAACEDGFEERDGACYQVSATTETTAPTDTETTTTTVEDQASIADILDALPACKVDAGDGALDIDLGCAGGACVGMTHDEVIAALGEPDDCTSIYVEFDGFAFSYLDCSWAEGISIDFDDEDLDGVADPDLEIDNVLAQGFEGTTAEGLGAGAQFACFRDVLGDPTSVDFEQGPEGEWLLTGISYPNLYVYDFYDNKDFENLSDGIVDTLSLYGSF